jgi:hypothetical protein
MLAFASEVTLRPAHPLFHGVYVAAAVPDSVALRAQALGLVLPAGGVVGMRTAAWLYGAHVLDQRDDRPEVVVPRGDQLRLRGARARSALLHEDDVIEVNGVAATSPVRTLVDLARQSDPVEAVVGADAMLATARCTLSDATAYLERCRGWRGVRSAAVALSLAEPNTQSPMETRQRMALMRAGLPRPTPQVAVRDESGFLIAYVDNGYETWRVGVDYDGEVHAKSWRQDLDRQERVHAARWWHRRYTALDAADGWRAMTRDVGRALVAAGWRPASR